MLAGARGGWLIRAPSLPAEESQGWTPRPSPSAQGAPSHDDTLSALLGRAVAVLDLLGLVQVEGVIDADGNAWIASVSPGPSAMLPLARQAGAELVGQYLRLARGETIDPHRLAYRDGVVLQGWRGSATS